MEIEQEPKDDLQDELVDNIYEKDDLQDELVDNIYDIEMENGPSSSIKEIFLVKTPDYDQIFKSNVFKFAVRKQSKGEFVDKIIFVKQYKKWLHDTKTDYLVEKIILPLIKDEKIFADLIKHDDENLRLFYETLSQKSLGEVLSENGDDSKISMILYSCRPVVKFIKEIPRYEYVITEAFKKKGLELKKLTDDYFNRKFDDYVKSLEECLNPKEKEKIRNKKKEMTDLVSENITPYPIGLRDGYPRHNLIGEKPDEGRLLDVAGICKCSPEFYLGTMIGCSSVYNKLPSPKEDNFSYLIKTLLQELNLNKDVPKSEKAIYAAAFFANLRSANRYVSFPEYSNFVKENVETALKQADFF